MSGKTLTNSKRSLPCALGLSLSLTLLISACGTALPPSNQTGRHLSLPDTSTDSATITSGIPSVVSPLPLLTAPQPDVDPELYTIVAQDVSIRELLFSMSRDTGINVDVNQDVTGLITLNAIDQSLPQILARISRQADIRWFFDEAGNLVVEPDSPYWRTYKIDYVNVSRAAETEATVSTSIVSTVGGTGAGGGGGGGSNNSTSSITQTFANNFWATLSQNLANLLGEGEAGGANSSIIANPESGVVTVRGTSRQQDEIALFINNVQTRSLRQVMIEATIVEVSLNDRYQSGVDWATIGRNSGEINFIQDLTGGNLANAPRNVLTIDKTNAPDAIGATISMLSRFGELRVLSSPKIMALNNQAAMLRVVDNTVYFNVEVEPGVISNGVSQSPTYTTSVNTVPVGFVMTITPQVSENDQVTLNVRPTISRILRYVDDPNPILAAAGVTNPIPETQVREFESILKVYDGQVAVLGGLMQDSMSNSSNGLPGLSRLRGLRNLFSYRDDETTKTELIIFIRPVIVRQPSLTGDLSEYRQYLPTNGLESSATLQPGQLPSLFSE